MRFPGWIGLSWALSSLLAAPVPAQQHYQPRSCDKTERTPQQLEAEYQLALRHAPILRFAPNARYFPTLPFFTALDDVDNDHDGRFDLDDSNEVTLRSSVSRRYPSWTLLNRAYRANMPKEGTARADTVLPSQEIYYGLNHSAVLFRVCQLSENEVNELFRFLKSDEQAWRRLQALDSLGEIIPDTTPLQVIQYYFYYVRDVGLEGHPEDIEMVFVFLPSNPVLARQFRVIVGSGHSDRTPNNVLVLFAPQMGLDSLTDSLNIIVEGGGHSSAPDMPPYGQFTPGVDVNWHIYDVWGTRDVQAVGGTGFTGHYRPEMTFARDGKNAVILFPSTYSRTERQVIQKQAQHVAGDSVISDSTVRNYRLVPVTPFRQLSQALEPKSPDTAQVATQIRAIARAISRDTAPGTAWNDWLFNSHVSCPRHQRASDPLQCFSSEQVVAAVGWLRAWNQNMIWKEGDAEHPEEGETRSRKKHQVWEHDGYLKDPTNIFKSHLFRPTTADVSGFSDVLRLLTWGVNGYPDDAYEVFAGFVVPAIPVPIRFPGYSEIQVGVYRSNFWAHANSSISISWVWEDHRNRLLSWYRKVSYIPFRSEVVGEDASDVGVAIGISLLPYIQPKSGPTDPINALRFRLGLRLDLDHPNDALRRVGWEIGIQMRQ